jgi:hypothetical protein
VRVVRLRQAARDGQQVAAHQRRLAGLLPGLLQTAMPRTRRHQPRGAPAAGHAVLLLAGGELPVVVVAVVPPCRRLQDLAARHRVAVWPTGRETAPFSRAS